MKLKSYSARTDQGPFLKINEDSYELDLVNNLFLLFDGFGGSGIGDKAVSLLLEDIKSFYTRISGDPDSTLPFYFSKRYLIEGNALINACHFAHKKLYEKNAALDISSRGGASGLICALAENILTLYSLGSCCAYLYRKGSFQRLFQEDTISLLTTDKYNSHLRTAPLSGFGLFHEVHPQIKELKVLDDDLVLLLTDGAYSRIDSFELKSIIEKKSFDLEEKINDIFELSNIRGNLDNLSCIILKF